MVKYLCDIIATHKNGSEEFVTAYGEVDKDCYLSDMKCDPNVVKIEVRNYQYIGSEVIEK